MSMLVKFYRDYSFIEFNKLNGITYTFLKVE